MISRSLAGVTLRSGANRVEIEDGSVDMVALVVLVLLLAILGGLGFAAHVLWYVLVFAVLLWLIGFFIGGVEGGGRRRWYGRW
jgi:fatty acid desaturase